MRNLIVLFCIVFSLASCKSENDKNAELASKNVAYYSHVWEIAINEGRTNILDTAYANDAVLHTVPEVKGKSNAKQYYENFVTGFSERKFTVIEIFASGNKLVKHWQFKGKHTGIFFGIPATGRDIDVTGCTIAKMKDGKITEEQDFMDNLDFMKQLGIITQ